MWPLAYIWESGSNWLSTFQYWEYENHAEPRDYNYSCPVVCTHGSPILQVHLETRCRCCLGWILGVHTEQPGIYWDLKNPYIMGQILAVYFKRRKEKTIFEWKLKIQTFVEKSGEGKWYKKMYCGMSVVPICCIGTK